VVEADRWMQANPGLKGDALAKAVNQQPWDPSVKALTAFSSVLAYMDKYLSWTSTLGDAYYNQPQDVMAAVQVMRQRAQGAGNLKTTQQEVVKNDGSTIVIEPANPEVVYVPVYDPVVVYEGYSDVYYSDGVDVVVFIGYGWGWSHWGCDWHYRYAEYDRERYYSRSRTFYDRERYYRDSEREAYRREESRDSRGSSEASRGEESRGSTRSEGERGNQQTRDAFEGDGRAARGYGDARGQSNTRTGGFSNYDHGGEERSFSERGRNSLGGSGFPRSGGFRHR
jgi:hypothetical protein